MKMKKLIYLITFILLTISCSKEKIDIPSNSKFSPKGILSFKDPIEFFSVVDSLNKLPTDQAKGYKSEEGFLSLFTIQENYYECLEYATDAIMYNNLILEHSDLLSKGSISQFKIYNKMVYPVINRDGIVQIGQSLYKFTEDGQIIINNTNLQKALLTTVSDKEDDNIKILKYDLQQPSKTDYCSNDHKAGPIYNDGDRRATLYSYVIVTIWPETNGTYTYRSDVWNEGIAEKKGIFGWKTYNTNNSLSLNYSVTLFNGISKTTTMSLSNTSNYRIYYRDTVDTGTITEDIAIYQGYFNWINCNIYTHQGMAGITAEICCESDPYGK